MEDRLDRDSFEMKMSGDQRVFEDAASAVHRYIEGSREWIRDWLDSTPQTKIGNDNNDEREDDEQNNNTKVKR